MSKIKANAKIWVHCIISTQNKLPLILPDNEGEIYSILRECFKNQQCKVETINGMAEHLHILLSLESLSKTFELIMEEVLQESKLLIDKEIYKAGSFSWEPIFAIFSVSQSQVSKVKEYIDNQKIIHKQKSFQKEWNELLKVHGIEQ